MSVHDAAGAHRLDDGRWVVSYAADVEAVLADPGAVIGFAANDAAGEVQALMARFSDGEAHERRRTIATDALAAIDVPTLRRAAFDETMRLLEGRTRAELMTTVARHVPVAVLAAALGTTDIARAVAASAELCTAIAPEAGRPRDDARTPADALAALLGTDPGEAGVNVAALLFQAMDATAGLIGNVVLAAGRLGWPSGDPAAFVVEADRLAPAVVLTTRRAVAPIVVGVTTIPADSTVVVALGAANRDAARFAGPDSFEPGRVATSLTFGAGPRRCPGREHAVAIASGVVEALRELDVVPAMSGASDTGGGAVAVDDEVRYEDRPNLRIPARLDVTVRGRRPASAPRSPAPGPP